MKYSSIAIATLTIGLALIWSLRFNEYFFKASLQDDFTLFVTAALAFTFFSIFRAKGLWKWFALIGAGLPWGLYILTVFLISNTYFGSLGLHCFMVVNVFIAMNLTKWKFLPLMSLVAVHFYPWSFPQAQMEYFDKVESIVETRKGSGRVLSWKGDRWHYYNGQLQFSTIDAHVWSEAYVQPVMQLIPKASKILLVGGESGLLVDELSKFKVDLQVLPYDQEFTNKIRPSESQAQEYLKGEIMEVISEQNEYAVIIIDLPDPINAEFEQYYTEAFYSLCTRALTDSGYLVTQSGDLISERNNPKDFLENAVAAGFTVTPYHTQIPTIGHWSWFIASKDSTDVLKTLSHVHPSVETKWWNQEAMDMMLSFGKYEILETR